MSVTYATGGGTVISLVKNDGSKYPFLRPWTPDRPWQRHTQRADEAHEGLLKPPRLERERAKGSMVRSIFF